MGILHLGVVFAVAGMGDWMLDSSVRGILHCGLFPRSPTFTAWSLLVRINSVTRVGDTRNRAAASRIFRYSSSTSIGAVAFLLSKEFMHDAVDWKIIDENPFLKVKTQKSSVKVNEFVPREVVDKLMNKASPVW